MCVRQNGIRGPHNGQSPYVYKLTYNGRPRVTYSIRGIVISQDGLPGSLAQPPPGMLAITDMEETFCTRHSSDETRSPQGSREQQHQDNYKDVSGAGATGLTCPSSGDPMLLPSI
ncbi:hypothetical protein NHX12_024280 [Muraenolepis orangiensis]|uniref:Uncharacterized protein n=1 Tax=Muraenolepis orangiensis TaxID=630683 RepID=A0A9Q0EM23_9TELE|nr:hypothetical protein NHX12_024280 [Muraenolepis orangiensis]